MYFPTIQGASPEKRVTDAFGGLNRGFECGDNEFVDMQNMTGEDFPYLSVRPARKLIANSGGAQLDLMIADHERQESYDKVTGVRLLNPETVTMSSGLYNYYYRGENQSVSKTVKLCFNGVNENSTVSYPTVSDMQGLVSFGNNVICYPKPEVINSGTKHFSLWLDKSSYGHYPGGYTYEDLKRPTKTAFSISPYTADGDENGYKIELHPTQNIGTDAYYAMYDNEEFYSPGSRLRLEKYSGTVLTGDDFGAAFFVVTKSEGNYDGSYDSYLYVYVRGYKHDGTPLTGLAAYSCTSADVYTDGAGVLITKIEADAGLLAVHQNRLWGTDTLGTSLYCSNATDFRDWKIDGTAAGGGYVDVPENTPWTAICEYGGYLYAFKANKMYKVMGSTALDYSILQVCEIGCVNHEAVCICDSVLYFLARDGVYGFTGNLPVKVSDSLGGEYRWGRMEGRGQKLYASIEKLGGGTEFLVYDTARRMWHREDDFKVRSFVDYADGLYALGEDRACYKLEGGTAGADVPFSVTTKKYFYTFDQKAVSCANLYIDMAEGSHVTVEIAYDGGAFADCGTFTNRRLQYIPVRLKKCDEFQLRISGNGFVRLKQLEFVLHGGGRTLR